jgi:hypothetical protein
VRKSDCGTADVSTERMRRVTVKVASGRFGLQKLGNIARKSRLEEDPETDTNATKTG